MRGAPGRILTTEERTPRAGELNTLWPFFILSANRKAAAPPTAPVAASGERGIAKGDARRRYWPGPIPWDVRGIEQVHCDTAARRYALVGDASRPV